MNTKTQCNKTVLAGESGCRVTYCLDCRVAEIEVGSVSLRLTEEAFRMFRHLIGDAVSRLDATQAGHAGFSRDARHVH